MNDSDKLQRFLFDNAPVRGEIVRLNTSFQTIIEQHTYPPSIRSLLGQALAVVSLLSAIIKFNGRLTVQFRGNGKVKLLLAQCNQHFQIRGLVQSQGELTEDELWDDLKNGVLAIMMDPDIHGGKRYQGIVAWQGHSFAETIEGYFNQSEQIPTRIWLAANENTAAGMLLQVMPSQQTHDTDDDAWQRLNLLSNTMTPNELLTLENQILLHRLFSEEKVRVFQQMPIEFKCNCSVKRSEQAVLLLGHEEAEEELKTKQNIIVTCEFCHLEYVFDRVDVARIFKEAGNTTPPSHLH